MKKGKRRAQSIGAWLLSYGLMLLMFFCIRGWYEVLPYYAMRTGQEETATGAVRKCTRDRISLGRGSWAYDTLWLSDGTGVSLLEDTAKALGLTDWETLTGQKVTAGYVRKGTFQDDSAVLLSLRAGGRELISAQQIMGFYAARTRAALTLWGCVTGLYLLYPLASLVEFLARRIRQARKKRARLRRKRAREDRLRALQSDRPEEERER